ncbi:class I SAM-dependent methyltransferase [Nitrosopumilus maritimus]|uniref:Methyltransferase type 11 n=1 Tax=Nitrosopumilus maritimus (strain SCM1) TaxID=436308 RepID=A9A3U1_NITMS|nr:class I SAM-dependent methyltransferase [Nitrosopumilus maritimus]ABX13353.1 Methyltransferase type 11 [Nitrosopumilus maritimus SCM1]
MPSFEDEMLDVMNKAAIALLLSVGHRTKLFDAMSKLEPSTSQEIATAANLNERYVREWLGGLVTSKIIDYDPESQKYSLSKEKAEFLTRDGEYNFASSMQWIPALAYVEDHIVDCFEKGGGVSYEMFNRFHTVMAEESQQTVLPALVKEILPLIPTYEKLHSGLKVLDVGCGSGRAINLMAKSFPNSHFTGYDFSSEAIQNAKNEAQKLGLSNVTFEKQDAANFDSENSFDVITAFDAIHDQANPDKVLENIKKALKPDGIFMMQDIRASSKLENNMNHSLAPYLYTVSCLHCMTVSLALEGKGLGAMWGKELATQMLNEAGFSSVDVKELPHDPINYYYIAKP